MAGGGESVFRIILRAIDQASPVITRAAALATAATARVQGAVKAGTAIAHATGLDVLGRGLGQVLRQVDAVGARALQMGRNLAIGLTAGAAGGGLLLGALNKLGGWGDELLNASRMLGMTTDQLQGMRFAAEQEGISIDTLNAAMGKFAQNASKAARGEGDAKDWFAALGINLTDSRGRLKGAHDLLLETLDRAKAMTREGSQLRVEMARAFWGRGGTDMVKLIQIGGRGVADALDELKAAGGHWSKDTIEAAERFDDEINKIGWGLRGIAGVIAGPLFAPLKELLDRFSRWLGANKELIAGKFLVWGERAAAVLKGLASGIGDVSAFIRRLIPDLGQGEISLATWEKIGRVLSLVFGVLLASALAHAAKAAALFGLALLKNPVTWITAAIFGLVWVIRNWGAVSKWAQGIWDRWAPLIIAAGMAITGALIPALLRLGYTVAVALGTGAFASLPLLLNPVTWIIAGIVAGVALLAAGAVYLYRNWAKVSASFKGFWAEWGNAILIIGGLLAGLVGGPVAWVAAAAALIINNWDELGEFFTGLGRKIKEIFREAVNYITSILPKWFREQIGLKATVETTPAPTPSSQPSRPSAAEALPSWRAGLRREEFSGNLRIDVNAPPGTRLSRQEFRGAEGLEVETFMDYGPNWGGVFP